MLAGRLLATLAAAAAFATAQAQVRSIPEDAKRGEMRHLQEMIVEIDGKPHRLAPGARIRDPLNRLVLPTAVPPGSVIRYLVSTEGHVREVWILTPEEAARP